MTLEKRQQTGGGENVNPENPVNVLFGDDMMRGLSKGALTVSNAAGVTLGPGGKRVLIKIGSGSPLLTKDGVTVCNAIRLSNETEDTGARLVVEASQRTNDEAGDSTTTAAVLAGALIEAGSKMLAAGISEIEVVEQLNSLVKHADIMLERLAAPADEDVIKKVVTVATNGDDKLAELVKQALGDNCSNHVEIVDVLGGDDRIETLHGAKFPGQNASPFLTTEPGRWKNSQKCAVIFIEGGLSTMEEVVPHLEATITRGTGIIFITTGAVEGSALKCLVINRNKMNVPICAFRLESSPWSNENLRDICAMMGFDPKVDVFGGNTGQAIATAKQLPVPEWVQLVVDRGGLTIKLAENANNVDGVNNRIDDINAMLATGSIPVQLRQGARDRTLRLNGRISTLILGGLTEPEVIERKHRAEDAVSSGTGVKRWGWLGGGGGALWLMADYLISQNYVSLTLANALTRVGSLVIENAMGKHGWKPPKLSKALLDNEGTPCISLSRKNGTWTVSWNENALQAGIIDSAGSVRSALRNAVSCAISILGAGALIVQEKN